MEVVPAKPGAFLASGYRCDVYAWGEDRVVKMFKPGADRKRIETEASFTGLVNAAGLPAPAVEGIVEVDGRAGIIYERILGPSLSSEVLSHPETASVLARQLAELHAKIHGKSISGLRSQRVGLERAISSTEALAPETKEAVIGLLNELPDGNAVCHGDLHLNNVIISPTGMVALDWDNVRSGNAIADVARSVLMLENSRCHVTDPLMADKVADLAAEFRDAYLTRYFEITGDGRQWVEEWMVPVAAARLRENIEVEEEALINVVYQGLIRRSS